MNLINEVDKPGSDIEHYVVSLDKYLEAKAEKINQIRNRLKKFNVMLKDEEALSAKFMNSNDVLDTFNQDMQVDDDNLLNVNSNIEQKFRK
jgi:kinesin family protein 2/24